MPTLRFAIAQARRVNNLIIAHKKRGDLVSVGECRTIRTLWVREARAIKGRDVASQAAEIRQVARDMLNCDYATHLARSSFQNVCLSAIVNNHHMLDAHCLVVWAKSGLNY